MKCLPSSWWLKLWRKKKKKIPEEILLRVCPVAVWTHEMTTSEYTYSKIFLPSPLLLGKHPGAFGPRPVQLFSGGSRFATSRTQALEWQKRRSSPTCLERTPALWQWPVGKRQPVHPRWVASQGNGCDDSKGAGARGWQVPAFLALLTCHSLCLSTRRADTLAGRRRASDSGRGVGVALGLSGLLRVPPIWQPTFLRSHAWPQTRSTTRTRGCKWELWVAGGGGGHQGGEGQGPGDGIPNPMIFTAITGFSNLWKDPGNVYNLQPHCLSKPVEWGRDSSLGVLRVTKLLDNGRGRETSFRDIQYHPRVLLPWKWNS